jgi:hypothetical protein
VTGSSSRYNDYNKPDSNRSRFDDSNRMISGNRYETDENRFERQPSSFNASMNTSGLNAVNNRYDFSTGNKTGLHGGTGGRPSSNFAPRNQQFLHINANRENEPGSFV